MIYKRKPKNFTPEFEVVSCFCEHDDKLLFLKRLKNKTQGGKWGVPTGKVDDGEDKLTALAREIFEETGINAKSTDLEYFKSIYVNHGYDFIYHMYHYNFLKIESIKLSSTEHESFKWVSVKDAFKLPLVDDLDECIRMFYVKV